MYEVKQKAKILLSFTHIYVILNPSDCFSLVEHKLRILVNDSISINTKISHKDLSMKYTGHIPTKLHLSQLNNPEYKVSSVFIRLGQNTKTVKWTSFKKGF